MGNGMNKIITGVYVGNFRDAKDKEQLDQHEITHILSVHDNAKELVPDRKYLCIIASDTPEQELSQFFPEAIKFIHETRLANGRVLIHCSLSDNNAASIRSVHCSAKMAAECFRGYFSFMEMAEEFRFVTKGVSRSVTLTAAYIMTVTELGWRDAINAIRGARSCANPNFGFQKQLQNYESGELNEARKNLKEKYPDNPFDDARECEALLKCFRHFVQTGETKSFSELYSLPHNAYGERRRRKTPADSSCKESCSDSVSKNSSDPSKSEVSVDQDSSEKLQDPHI